jgi:hypothetical protein
VRPRLTELFSKIATQAAKLFEELGGRRPYEGGGEGRVGDRPRTDFYFR